MPQPSRSLTATAWICAALLGSAALANPSDQEPDAPLALHDLTRADAVLSKATPLMARTARDVQGITAGGAKATIRQLVDAHVALRQLERGALDLQMHGETAGVDYGLRVKRLRAELQQAINAFLARPTSGPQIAKVRLSLQNQRPTLDKMLQRARGAADAQRWGQAYDQVHQMLDQITSHVIFLAAQDATPFEQHYTLTREITLSRNKALREQVQASLEKAAAETAPDTAALLTAIADASRTLQSQDTAAIGDQPLTGPQCVEHFFQQWQQIHLAALRCRATEWARQTAIPDLAYLPASAPSNRIDNEQYDQFCQQLADALAGILTAEAGRATAEECSGLHAEYLRVLAPMLARTADDRFHSAAQQALDQLAAGSPPLAEQVAAYRAATDELLRWRERVAAEAAQARAGRFPEAAGLLQQTFTSRGEYRGLLAEAEPDLNRAALLGSAPEALAPAPEQLIGHSVRVNNIVGLPGDRLAVAAYARRHYATLPRVAWAEQTAALRRDLMVDDQLPPLSLAAAVALGSAQQGDARAAGGPIQSVHLEGLIPRFAVLPAAAAAIAPLGPLPAETAPERQMLSHVVIRLQLTPSWVQHRYFFVEVPPTGG